MESAERPTSLLTNFQFEAVSDRPMINTQNELLAAAIDILPQVTNIPLAIMREEEEKAAVEKAARIVGLLAERLCSIASPSSELTTEPRSFNFGPVVETREWIRLPKKGRCPYSGLTRSTLNNLILPCEINGFKPPVRSVSLRKRTQVRGTRLIHYGSLMSYIRGMERKQQEEQDASPRDRMR